MDANFVNGLLTAAIENVNASVIIALMAIGFVIKHFKFLDKISNDFIPPILFVLSFVICFIDGGLSLSTTITAIVNSAIAIGLHQSGKNIFTVSIIPAIIAAIKSSSSKVEEEKEEESE